MHRLLLVEHLDILSEFYGKFFRLVSNLGRKLHNTGVKRSNDAGGRASDFAEITVARKWIGCVEQLITN